MGVLAIFRNSRKEQIHKDERKGIPRFALIFEYKRCLE
jgi:hypothetical protein